MMPVGAAVVSVAIVPRIVPAVIAIAVIPGIVPTVPSAVGPVVIRVAVVVRITVTVVVRVAVVEVVNVAGGLVVIQGLATDFLAGHLFKIFLGEGRFRHYVLCLEIYAVLKLLNPLVLFSQAAGCCSEGGQSQG